MSRIHVCRVFPVGSEIQRGSLMSSHAKMAGSFLYATPVTVLTLVRTVCKKKERHKTTTDHEQLDFEINNLRKKKKKKKKLYDPKLAIKCKFVPCQEALGNSMHCIAEKKEGR
jgi:hypothetical protein